MAPSPPPKRSAGHVNASKVEAAIEADVVVGKVNKLTLAIRKSIGWIWVVRVVLTLMIATYVAVIISMYAKAPEQDEATRRNADFARKVLFGDQGMVPPLFWLWVLTVIAVACAPLLLHVLHRVGLVDKNT
jgi:hypothetical protein